MPLAAVRHGRARQSSGTGPCGYCRRVLWSPGPACKYSGKIRFIEKPGVENEGCRHVVKRSSDPGYPPRRQSSGTGPSAGCGYCCPLCLHGGQYPGTIRFIEPQGENGHMRPEPGAPSSGTPRESQAKFRDGTVCVL